LFFHKLQFKVTEIDIANDWQEANRMSTSLPKGLISYWSNMLQIGAFEKIGSNKQ